MKPQNIRNLITAAALSITLVTTGCVASMKDKVAIRKPETLALMEKAKTESFNANAAGVQALHTGMKAEGAATAKLSFFYMNKKAVAAQWSLLGETVDGYFTKWQGTGGGTGKLRTAYVNEMKDVVSGDFDRIP